jgi:hypothetical protein
VKRLSLLVVASAFFAAPSFAQKKPLEAVILYGQCRTLNEPATGDVASAMGAGACIGYVTAVLDLTPGQSFAPDEAAHAFVDYFEGQFGTMDGTRLHVTRRQDIEDGIAQICEDRKFKPPCDDILRESATTVLREAITSLQRRATGNEK